MTIDMNKSEGTLIVSLEGRLDTTTAPELETKLDQSLDGVNNLIFDMKELSYISSAGLRVLLTSQKKMNRCGGDLTVRNANDDIMDVFEVTGFIDMLNIEN